tara:strand:+ start:235 stop:486 length:252 start_codon:yes stop_codon:yes gene_type:complete
MGWFPIYWTFINQVGGTIMSKVRIPSEEGWDVIIGDIVEGMANAPVWWCCCNFPLCDNEYPKDEVPMPADRVCADCRKTMATA